MHIRVELKCEYREHSKDNGIGLPSSRGIEMKPEIVLVN
jgi:hypothetical protein